MTKIVCGALFLLLINIHSFSQNFESSNLPIVIINTDGLAILDEPKITARMQIIDNPDGERNDLHSETYEYNGSIGIELRGQSSQDLFPKKSYGIETRDESGDDIDVSLLGLPMESDWVIHAPYSDKSLIRNALAYLLAAEIMVYAPRVRMAELVINGDYKGVILWTEKIKRGRDRVDISKLDPDENSGDDLTGGYILKFDKGDPNEIGWESPYNPITYQNQRTRFLYHYPKPEDISIQQKTYIKGFITDFENVLMSANYADPVNGYEKYIDVESFIRTIIINELTRNIDGYRLSTYMYKDKDSKGGKLAMGPTWDHNLSWGNVNYCDGADITGWALDFNDVCPGDYWLNHVWWNRLVEEGNFRQRLKDRWFELRKDALSNENILGKIDSLVNLLEEASDRNFVRWPVLGQYVWPNNYIGGSYEAEVNYLKSWVTDRTGWLDNSFKALTTSVTSIDQEQDIRLYPNPTSGRFYIESNGDLLSVDIITMDGHKIQSVVIDQPFMMVDLNHGNYGGLIWYRMIKKDGNIITGKIFKIDNN